MVRPERFELPTLWFVARCSIQLSYGRDTVQPAEISIIAETLLLMNTAGPPTFRHPGGSLQLKVSFSRLQHRHCTGWCLFRGRSKSFSRRQFLLCPIPSTALYFQAVGIGKPSATRIGRRSGAQRGALEDKLRPEVFLDAPCIFPSTISSGRRQTSPKAHRWPMNSFCAEFFPDVQSRFPQQSRNHRLFEA